MKHLNPFTMVVIILFLKIFELTCLTQIHYDFLNTRYKLNLFVSGAINIQIYVSLKKLRALYFIIQAHIFISLHLETH